MLRLARRSRRVLFHNFCWLRVAQIPVQEHLRLPDIRMHDPGFWLTSHPIPIICMQGLVPRQAAGTGLVS